MHATQPRGTPPLPEPLLRYAAIAAGGATGTLARYGVNRALDRPGLGFSWPTFIVNVVGSFLLGLVIVLVAERWPPTRFVRPLVAVGFCGGFTTYSTLMVEVAQRGQHGRVGPAVLYLGASVVAGVVAVVVGMAAGRGRFRPLPTDRSIPDPDDLGQLSTDPDGKAGPR